MLICEGKKYTKLWRYVFLHVYTFYNEEHAGRQIYRDIVFILVLLLPVSQHVHDPLALEKKEKEQWGPNNCQQIPATVTIHPPNPCRRFAIYCQ